jgi:hypothetical protein
MFMFRKYMSLTGDIFIWLKNEVNIHSASAATKSCINNVLFSHF